MLELSYQKQTWNHRHTSLKWQKSMWRGRSLIYIMNNKGPKTEPYGTPALTSLEPDSLPDTCTCCWLFLSHLLIARCDIGVQLSVRSFVRSSVCPSVHNLCQGAYSVAVIAGSMKPCIVITLDTHFKKAPWPSALDLDFTLHWLCKKFVLSLENLRRV